MDERIKIGSVIYFYDQAMQATIKGIVRDLYLENSQMAVEIRMESVVEPDGSENPVFGTIYKKLDEIHLNKTHAEAKSAQKTNAKTLQEYCREIVSIEDLIKFPIRYDLCGNDTDPECVEAYKKRAKELIGIQFL